MMSQVRTILLRSLECFFWDILEYLAPYTNPTRWLHLVDLFFKIGYLMQVLTFLWKPRRKGFSLGLTVTVGHISVQGLVVDNQA